jgi:predicted nuclease with RNAse H fold
VSVIAGIDYGSKLAGTTVLAILEGSKVQLFQSIKKQDADAMLLDKIAQFKPEFVMLDAPLSLPGVFQQLPDYHDYFYRKADKELQAMSPMFLGGLTARAMKLSHQLAQLNIPVYETYPKLVADRIGLKDHYAKSQKGETLAFVKLLADKFSLRIDLKSAITWHHADALLALIAAIRFQDQEIDHIGDQREGLIWV